VNPFDAIISTRSRNSSRFISGSGGRLPRVAAVANDAAFENRVRRSCVRRMPFPILPEVYRQVAAFLVRSILYLHSCRASRHPWFLLQTKRRASSRLGLFAPGELRLATVWISVLPDRRHFSVQLNTQLATCLPDRPPKYPPSYRSLSVYLGGIFAGFLLSVRF